MARALIPYLGGKTLLADELTGRINLYANKYGLTRYVEPCGGSGKVIMEAPDSLHRVYNDIGLGLVDLIRCIQDGEKVEKLISLLNEIDCTENSFYYAVNNWDKEGVPKLERAAYAYISAQLSIVGNMKNYYKSYMGYENDEFIADYYPSLDDIRDFHWLLRGVEIRRNDLMDIIEDYRCDPRTLIYIDPPYVMQKSKLSRKSKKHYKHHFGVEEHAAMVDLLLKEDTVCKVMVSGYDTPLYDRLLNNGWHKKLLDIIPVVGSVFGGKVSEVKEAREMLWTNFDPYVFSV